ncbi:UDP-N-acetylgalactosamine-undecaprenyl-phosphate N-acetylgalactosaminephosphotransferase [Eggerthella lenta]|uniref:UDP-N-acetylgalactosamine-undecaprenyl-phosphate N-acetylgalactosaminephosphotransferase n=9 Tax=Eggerthellaceae TaxID=1643826 RepID=A0A6N3DVT7_EGGLN
MFERNPDKSIDVTADGAVALVDDFATAGEQEEISTPPMSDKRGYVKSSELEASDLAFLAPELTSEAEGPVRAPARADGRWGYRFVKRAFDIAFSLVAIAVLLIPSIVLCAAIRLESPGNPLYSQKRVGRIGRDGQIRTFDMYKFRSMHKDADERLAELADLNEADGPLFKIKDDPRVTRIGKFIRKHSIDELPQFLNCLMGQLSCVGPRPPLPSEVAQYDERAMRRLSVKPGLTGYWQVRGRSDTTFDDMVDMDLAYIEERSFSTDLRVIAKTVITMFDGKGAC